MDLLKYCSRDEAYPELLKPFSNVAYTYACNGHFAVRVPRRPEYHETGAGRHLLIDEHLDNVPHSWQAIPAFNLPELEFMHETEEIPLYSLIHPAAVMFKEMGEGWGIHICYLSWIVNFNKPTISFDCGSDVSPDKVIAFKFEGGEGIVTPAYT